ncbi:Di-sulfide bridge nucleocytoplasmic transport domain-domain-containing protein [Kockovaella imperatae]|uniref:Di-sulfide bridge nucleocytoplasmic transport domain-domain-containing protein n=1 Tax=Kockovaella imperatae TaxID=4999 RepID=A0A1Y1UKP3_9TREE|nr:Di-sulfide bridge nucleocytoplasmic transport domain-domain-containing protein [Kockovaella imperatae]ORX37705.1 Di-sulfide bridge nucleocytoplasmic transport domain-domain-containing protein [Kockovaella imperatae]
MYRHEPRATYGPMDIDQPDPSARIAQFALPDHEEGPSRKRPHNDLSSPSSHAFPSSSTSSTQGLRFDSNVPFMFYLPSRDRPETPTKSWDSIYAMDITPQNLGYGPTPQRGIARGAEDVEMFESPDRRVMDDRSTNLPSPPPPPAPPLTADRPETKSSSKSTDGGQENHSSGSRPIAKGGMKRELKRREKKRDQQRNQGNVRPYFAIEGLTSRQTEPLRTEHQHHYNFHTHAPSLRHTEIPSLLIGYVQVFVNVAVVLAVLYLFLHLLLAIRRDVHDRMIEVSTEILQEIAECNHLYLTNRCDPALRVPAMDAPCKAWEACLKRDPTKVQRTSVLAETFASVINSFVEPISWKTMGFTLSTLSFLVILTNSALWNLRSKTSSPSRQPEYDHPYPFPPPHQLQNWPYPQHSAAAPSGLASNEKKQIGYGPKKWWKPW